MTAMNRTLLFVNGGGRDLRLHGFIEFHFGSLGGRTVEVDVDDVAKECARVVFARLELQ